MCSCWQDAVKDFERNLSDMVATFVENVQGHTSVLRDLENTHHQRLEEIAMVTLEKVVKNEMEDDIPDELRDVSVTSPHITSKSKTSHVSYKIDTFVYLFSFSSTKIR